ncbi:MAG: YggT family protein [Eubacteriales bacterium]
MIIILINAVQLFFQVVVYIILARLIMSWFVRNPYSNKIYMLLIQLTEPILAPFRKLLGRFGASYGVDFSPILALLAINLISMLIVRGLFFLR